MLQKKFVCYQLSPTESDVKIGEQKERGNSSTKQPDRHKSNNTYIRLKLRDKQCCKQQLLERAEKIKEKNVKIGKTGRNTHFFDRIKVESHKVWSIFFVRAICGI